MSDNNTEEDEYETIYSYTKGYLKNYIKDYVKENKENEEKVKENEDKNKVIGISIGYCPIIPFEQQKYESEEREDNKGDNDQDEDIDDEDIDDEDIDDEDNDDEDNEDEDNDDDEDQEEYDDADDMYVITIDNVPTFYQTNLVDARNKILEISKKINKKINESEYYDSYICHKIDDEITIINHLDFIFFKKQYVLHTLKIFKIKKY